LYSTLLWSSCPCPHLLLFLKASLYGIILSRRLFWIVLVDLVVKQKIVMNDSVVFSTTGKWELNTIKVKSYVRPQALSSFLLLLKFFGAKFVCFLVHLKIPHHMRIEIRGSLYITLTLLDTFYKNREGLHAADNTLNMVWRL
jgi:hypothetical protein